MPMTRRSPCTARSVSAEAVAVGSAGLWAPPASRKSPDRILPIVMRRQVSLHPIVIPALDAVLERLDRPGDGDDGEFIIAARADCWRRFDGRFAQIVGGYGHAMIHDTTPGVRKGVSPLIDVLQLAEASGFAAEFEVAGDASGHEDLWCPHCEVESSASSFERAWSLRLEGASDPADMLHVSALKCPNCGTGGVFVTPFGPIASQRQACVLRALPEAEHDGPPSPD